MIDDMLNILDRLTDVARLRNSAAKKRFADLVEPSMNEIELIHKDYISIFEVAEKIIGMECEAGQVSITNDCWSAVKKAFDFLSERRQEFDPVRRKYAVFARAFAKPNLQKMLQPNERDFFRLVHRYLEPQIATTDSSVLLSLLRDARELLTRLKRRKGVVEGIHTAAELRQLNEAIVKRNTFLRRTFDEISDTYGKLLSVNTKGG
jgi:hypothetical protein